MSLKKIFAVLLTLALTIGLLPDYSTNFKDNVITSNALPAYNDSIVYKKTNGYIAVLAANDQITSAIIPDEIEGLPVKRIESYGFSGCSNLSNVRLPKYLEEIGEDAFYQCDSLVSIDFPASLKKIGYSAFYDCSKLQNVTFQEGLETIRPLAFGYCTKMESITLPSTLKSIDENAFKYCVSIDELTIKSTNCTICSTDKTLPKNAVLYGYEGSTVQKYASTYGRTFNVISGSSNRAYEKKSVKNQSTVVE